MTEERVHVTESELGEMAAQFAEKRLDYLKSTGKLTLSYYGTEDNLAKALRESFLRDAGEHYIVTPDAKQRQKQQQPQTWAPR